MKRASLTATLAAIVVFAGVCAFAGITASAAPSPIANLVEPPVMPRDSVDESATDAPTGLAHARLRDYVLRVIGGWPDAPASLDVANYADVADDIASAANGNPDDAILLAGLGYFEGARYAAYVDGYGCNSTEWRLSDEGKRVMRKWGDCDGGRAYSLWQIHPIVDRSSRLYSLCNLEMVGFSGSRFNAARCALAIAHSGLDSMGNLSGYTGEPSFDGGHPKADERLTFVREAIARHPFTP